MWSDWDRQAWMFALGIEAEILFVPQDKKIAA